MPEVPDVSGSDASMFRQLFEGHSEALRRYAQRIVRSRDAAEDLVQDAFLRLWRSWGRVEIGPNPRAYLYVLTRSLALNHLKREKTEARARHMSYPRGISSVEPALP